MKFGFGLITCQQYPGDPRTDEDLYREALLLAEDAERLGFDSVWVSEHHFFDDGYMPALLPVCAAIAARTSRIEIGTGVLLAPLYDPIRLAEDAATVDLISGGRLLLGLGQGWRPEEFEGFRIPLRERRQRFEDTFTVLREAWSDGLVHGGRVLAYPGISVTPKPARPGGPPLWIGGHSEVAIRRAGRVADGFMASWASPEMLTTRVSWVREGLEEAGRDEASFAFSVHVGTFAWPGEDAWRIAAPHYHYIRWKYGDMAEARARTRPPRMPPAMDAEAEEILRGGAPDGSRGGVVIGTPELVAEHIARLNEAAGGDLHYVADLYCPGLDLGLQREALAIFAQDVIPRLR